MRYEFHHGFEWNLSLKLRHVKLCPQIAMQSLGSELLKYHEVERSWSESGALLCSTYFRNQAANYFLPFY